MAADLLDDLSPADRKTGALIAGRAAARAPHRSGRLAASIRPHSTTGGVSLSANVPYSGVIHWGWPARNIRAHTFLVDAARTTESTWTGYYTDAVQDALDKVAAR